MEKPTQVSNTRNKVFWAKATIVELQAKLEKAIGRAHKNYAFLLIGIICLLLYLPITLLDTALLEQPLELILPPMAGRWHSPIGTLQPLACAVAILAIALQAIAILIVFESGQKSNAEDFEQGEASQIPGWTRWLGAAVLLACLFLACYGGFMRGSDHSVSSLGSHVARSMSYSRYLNLVLSACATVSEWIVSLAVFRAILVGRGEVMWLRFRTWLFLLVYGHLLRTEVVPKVLLEAKDTVTKLSAETDQLHRAADLIVDPEGPVEKAATALQVAKEIDQDVRESDIPSIRSRLPKANSDRVRQLESDAEACVRVGDNTSSLAKSRFESLDELRSGLAGSNTNAYVTASPRDLMAKLDSIKETLQKIVTDTAHELTAQSLIGFDPESANATFKVGKEILSMIDRTPCHAKDLPALIAMLETRTDFGMLTATRDAITKALAVKAADTSDRVLKAKTKQIKLEGEFDAVDLAIRESFAIVQAEIKDLSKDVADKLAQAKLREALEQAAQEEALDIEGVGENRVLDGRLHRSSSNRSGRKRGFRAAMGRFFTWLWRGKRRSNADAAPRITIPTTTTAADPERQRVEAKN